MATQPDPSLAHDSARGTMRSAAPAAPAAHVARPAVHPASSPTGTRRRRARHWFAPCLVAGALGVPAPATAASPEAEQLFERGLEQMKAGSIERGCDLIEQSHTLDPLPGALFTLAECRARAGQDVRAWTRFRQFLAVDEGAVEPAAAHQARVEAARRRLREIEERIARVTLVLPASDGGGRLELFVDGRAEAGDDEPVAGPFDDTVTGSSGETRRELAFEPGKYTFRLRSDDGAEERIDVSLRAGEARTIQMTRPRGMVAPPPPKDEPASGEPATPRPSEDANVATPSAEPVAASSGPGLWTYTAFGIGAAGLVTGSVAGAVLISRKNTIDRYCTGSVCEEPGYRATRGIDTLDTVANVGFVVGALGVGVGLWFALGVADEGETQSKTRLQVGMDGNQALLRGTW